MTNTMQIDRFNTTGKIPTGSKFWEVASETLVSGQGITQGFSKVLGEQVFAPLQNPRTPFYNEFAGRPITEGTAWMERLIKIKAPKKFNPKAGASDDLGFYDSEGIERVFHLGFEGWRPVSLPSDLVSAEMFNSPSGIAELNNILVDAMMNDYQEEMNDDCGVKAVTTTLAEKSVDITDMDAIRKTVRDTATEMMGRDIYYNNFTAQQNKDYRLGSNEVIAFIDAKVYNTMNNDTSELPSPDRIVNNVRFIPVFDGLPRPLTTGEYTAGQGTNGWDTPTNQLALDKDAPSILLMSTRRIELRPYRNNYRVNLSRNGAGDFNNVHLLYKGTIGIRPWENAVRIIPS